MKPRMYVVGYVIDDLTDARISKLKTINLAKIAESLISDKIYDISIDDEYSGIGFSVLTDSIADADKIADKMVKLINKNKF